MKETRIIVDIPVTVEVNDAEVTQKTFDKIFDYFSYVHHTFDPDEKDSELSQINRGELEEEVYSDDMRTVLALCEDTKDETGGYFNIQNGKKLDPSGMVKGWAIHNASILLTEDGFENFYIEAGSDIEAHGKNDKGKPWHVGIRHPFKHEQVVKVITLRDCALATSRTNIRDQQIYNPLQPKTKITDIVSLSVIGPNAYEADRFSTAAVAMGYKGIAFIEKLPGFEGYLIDKNGMAIFTKGFSSYIV
ncbi:MAG: FAD:protein FMN transferase [Patescibacteria group bacterium]|jgi:thiamine biosynthesis lipoprotein